ncbi:MAG: hypothetical protein WCD49_03845 [Candidatus Acidiferrales bacterium]
MINISFLVPKAAHWFGTTKVGGSNPLAPTIVFIADGEIVENWYLPDSLSLDEQLGMKLTPADASK